MGATQFTAVWAHLVVRFLLKALPALRAHLHLVCFRWLNLPGRAVLTLDAFTLCVKGFSALATRPGKINLIQLDTPAELTNEYKAIAFSATVNAVASNIARICSPMPLS